jgi:hypothetical protein
MKMTFKLCRDPVYPDFRHRYQAERNGHNTANGKYPARDSEHVLQLVLPKPLNGENFPIFPVIFTRRHNEDDLARSREFGREYAWAMDFSL